MPLNIKYIKNCFLTLVLFVWGTSLFAQNVVAALSSSRVEVGEKFELSYTIGIDNASKFLDPPLSDFTIHRGRTKVGESIINNNGRVTREYTFNYILSAKKPGKYTIQPGTVVAGGANFTSNSVTIEVVKASSSAGNDVFIRIVPELTKVQLGQVFTVKYKLYFKWNLAQVNWAKPSNLEGFWAHEIPLKMQQSNERIGNTNYAVVEFLEYVLLPQRSGTIEIPSLSFDCVASKPSGRQMNVFDPWGLMGQMEEQFSVKAIANPVKIEVLPLPKDNQPKDFNGAVGNFKVEARLTRSKLKTNEASNLLITLSGNGNLKFIDSFKLNIPEGIEKFDPKVTDKIAMNQSGMSGSKTFDYVLIPRKSGKFTISGLRLDFFNPKKQSYESIQLPDLNLEVEKGPEGENNEITGNSNTVNEDSPNGQAEIAFLQKLVKGIKITGWILVSLLLATLLFFILRWVWRKQKERREQHSSDLRRFASKEAMKHLKAAKAQAEAQQKEAFYAALHTALLGYFSQKLIIPMAELSTEKIKEGLAKLQVDKVISDELMTLFSNCEYSRYAPVALNDDLHMVYEQAVRYITEIEKKS